jgi:hypothetical protein
MKNGIYTSWSLWSIKKRMDIVTAQPGMDRLGAGSIVRGLFSNPTNSRRIVMKSLWGLGSYLRVIFLRSGRICMRNYWSIKRRKDLVLMCQVKFLLEDGYVSRGGVAGMEN